MKRTRIVMGIVGLATMLGSVPAFAGQIPVGPFGRVESDGKREIQVDGSSSSPLVAAHPWADGYISLSSNGDNGNPALCAGGDNDYRYYHYWHPTEQDCNAALADEENQGYLMDALGG